MPQSPSIMLPLIPFILWNVDPIVIQLSPSFGKHCDGSMHASEYTSVLRKQFQKIFYSSSVKILRHEVHFKTVSVLPFHRRTRMFRSKKDLFHQFPLVPAPHSPFFLLRNSLSPVKIVPFVQLCPSRITSDPSPFFLLQFRAIFDLMIYFLAQLVERMTIIGYTFRNPQVDGSSLCVGFPLVRSGSGEGWILLATKGKGWAQPFAVEIQILRRHFHILRRLLLKSLGYQLPFTHEGSPNSWQNWRRMDLTSGGERRMNPTLGVGTQRTEVAALP